MASLSPLPDMTCIFSCRIPGPRAETATKINRLSIYMYNPRVDMRPKPQSFGIRKHTLYPGCNIFVYIADQKQPNTSRARMDCGKLTLFLLLQMWMLKRGVASQDFAEKHSVPIFMSPPVSI